MHSSARFGRRGISVCLVVALGLSFTGAPVAAQAAPSADASDEARASSAESRSSVISDDLAAELGKGGDRFDVMVLFKEKVSLDEAVESASSDPAEGALEVRERKAVVGALQETAALSQDSIVPWLEKMKEEGSVESYEQFFIINAVHVVANAQVISELAAVPSVKSIDVNHELTRDEPIEVKRFNLFDMLGFTKTEVEWNIDQVGADNVWEKYGVNGTGVTVGIIDTAADATHPALKSKFRGYNAQTGELTYEGNYVDCVGDTTSPEQARYVAHGTHVAGTILGSEVEENGSTYTVGMAPGATWINARVFNDYQRTDDAALARAAEWMLKPGGDITKAPSIINNSWGTTDGKNAWYAQYIDAWRAAGILPVFSAGNMEPGENEPVASSIVSPASYAKSFAVAAVDRSGKRGYFSKLGPSPIKGVTGPKPEISAPGVDIRSSIRGGYGYMNGTSMAAPHVTGAAALIKSAKPTLSDADIQNLLEETATSLTDSDYPSVPNMAYGYGCIDVYDAVAEALGDGTATVKGDVTCNGVPVKADIAVSETGQTATTDEKTGAYVLKHAAGTFTVTCDVYGYEHFEKQVEIKKDEPLSFDIALVKKQVGTINGVVSDEKGTPVEGAHVRVVNGNDANLYVTSSAGEFSIPDLPEGSYRVRVFKEGFQAEEKTIEVKGSVVSEAFGLTEAPTVVQKKISHHEGDANTDDRLNLTIGMGGYMGCAVCFVPYMEGGVITNASVYVPVSNLNGNDKAKLSILEKDNRGRTKTLLGPLDVTVKQGVMQTFDLEEYQVKTDKPYYVAISTPSRGVAPFLVGVDNSGDGSFSYIYSGSNLVPLSGEGLDGALMIRSTMEYPEGAKELSIQVGKPAVSPVKPLERRIKGIAAPNQDLKFTIGSNRINARAEKNGSFSVEVPFEYALTPGTEVYGYGKDVNGLLSDPATTFVTTERSDLDRAVTAARALMSKNVLSAEQTESLEKLLEDAGSFLDTVDSYESGDQLEKARIVEHQEQIESRAKQIRQTLLSFSPHKQALLADIQKAQAEIDASVRSKDGAGVPVTRYWVTPLDYINLATAIIRAKTKYESVLATDDEVDAARRQLDHALGVFDSKKKQGADAAEADETALLPVTRAIERAADALKRISESGDGRDIDPAARWATPEDRSKLEAAIDAAKSAAQKSGLTAESIRKIQAEIDQATADFESKAKLGLRADLSKVRDDLRKTIWNAKVLLYETRQFSAARSLETDFARVESGAVFSSLASFSLSPEAVLPGAGPVIDRASFIKSIDAAQATFSDSRSTPSALVTQNDYLNRSIRQYKQVARA